MVSVTVAKEAGGGGERGELEGCQGTYQPPSP